MKKTTLALSSTVLALAVGAGTGYAAGIFATPGAEPFFDPGLIARLQLTREQQQQWQEVDAARRQNLRLLQTRLTELRQTLDRELAGDNPDLQRVTRQSEQAVDELIRAVRLNRDRRLSLYAGMGPEQKREVRDTLKQALNRWDHLRSGLVRLLGGPLS